MTVCLSPAMHYGVHGGLNVALRALGEAGPVRGTAPMRAILASSVGSIDLIPTLPPNCKAEAKLKAQQQFFSIAGQPGRTTMTLPKPDAVTVLARGSY